ncbi:bifunctional 2-C-methyl-D-erythritol 4-phosphate cytidylyltransferase/2-C-methyl-D-erythritol 2,4-cyclodiphosphate synthase [soil metagenome]
MTPFADAVVVAAGSSRRMAGRDKLDATLEGRSVLRWAVEGVAASAAVRRVVVVAAPHRVEEFHRAPWLRRLDAAVVPGGARRQESVAAGVALTASPVVLVHDGARPFVTPELVARVAAAADRHGAAVPVLPQVDALKRLAGEMVGEPVDRTGLVRVQTPQGARRDLLRAAVEHHAHGPDTLADEAELLARDGVPVATVPGEADNIKVTVPGDLELARRLAEDRSVAIEDRFLARVAQGWDSHPFGPEDGLRLGGLLIVRAPRLMGHSDGDVVLHALCDGLLAAAGLGDLGRLFPSGEPSTRDIESTRLLADVVGRLADLGLRPARADVTILGARPRLGATGLDAMAERLAALLGLDPGRISVKASSGNLGGDEGAGRSISASCLVVVAGS